MKFKLIDLLQSSEEQINEFKKQIYEDLPTKFKMVIELNDDQTFNYTIKKLDLNEILIMKKRFDLDLYAIAFNNIGHDVLKKMKELDLYPWHLVPEPTLLFFHKEFKDKCKSIKFEYF